MAHSEDPLLRETAFRVFTGSPNLIMDLQPETVVAVLEKGLQDPHSVEVSVHTQCIICLLGYETPPLSPASWVIPGPGHFSI